MSGGVHGPCDGVEEKSPDADLLARIRRALDRWEAREDGPTSSLTGGGAIRALEDAVTALCRVRFALAVSSATVGLWAALVAVGVRPGREVLCPALGWPAAAAAVRAIGARPVPVDVAAGTFTVGPEEVRRRISARTAAAVVTHLAGVPADVDAVRAVCDPAGVPVIEDAAQALGARIRGRPVGGLGTAGVFSFSRKAVDALEGGILVTDDVELHRRAVAATQHPVRQLLAAIDPPNLLALTGRMHPVAAMMAVLGLEELDAMLSACRARAIDLAARASAVAGVTAPVEPSGWTFSWPCAPAIVNPAANKKLAEVGVLARTLDPIYLPDVLGVDPGPTPIARATAPLLHRLTEIGPKLPAAG